MIFIQGKDFGKKKEDRQSLGYRHLSPECLTSSYHTMTHEVPASQMMATQTSPQASHRASPTLSLSTRKKYTISRRRAMPYITHLKEGVLRQYFDKNGGNKHENIRLKKIKRI